MANHKTNEPFGISEQLHKHHSVDINKIMHNDNIICLPGELGRYAVIRSNPVERVTLMSTYEEFMVILTVALLIVAILNYKK